jgi:hypothetical protein
MLDFLCLLLIIAGVPAEWVATKLHLVKGGNGVQNLVRTLYFGVGTVILLVVVLVLAMIGLFGLFQ